MIIGIFSETHDGYLGELVTLNFRGMLTFEPTGRGADYLVMMAGAHVGAAWKKTHPATKKTYLSVELDSPFLPRPLMCALVPRDDGTHVLTWSRGGSEEGQHSGLPGDMAAEFLSPKD